MTLFSLLATSPAYPGTTGVVIAVILGFCVWIILGCAALLLFKRNKREPTKLVFLFGGIVACIVFMIIGCALKNPNITLFVFFLLSGVAPTILGIVLCIRALRKPQIQGHPA